MSCKAALANRFQYALKSRLIPVRFANPAKARWLIGAAVLAVAIPVIGQDSPESILPPGFGDPVEDAKPTPKPPRNPDNSPRLDDPDPAQLRPDSSVASGTLTSTPSGDLLLPGADSAKEGEEEEALAPAVLQDLPAF
jgi:hypothetical protein